MGDGISNTEIKVFFEKERNEDIRKNFMGVYSMDNVTKYINFYEIVKLLQFSIQIIIINQELTGGVF